MPDTDHVCTEESCPLGTYYVSVVDGSSWWRMAGPYNTHQDALADVDRVRNIANEHDGRAWFMGWGTIRDREGKRELGNLNRAGLI